MFQGLRFASTREDPKVELNAISELQRIFPNKLSVALICSGGCTLLTLLGNLTELELHAVDLNPYQLDLFQFKYDLLTNSPQPNIEEYKTLIGLLDSRATYERVFRELRDSHYNFKEVFSHSNLTSHFGKDAVEHSLNKSFASHMEAVFPKMRGYFRDLIVEGKITHHLPIFLREDSLSLLRKKSHSIYLYHQDMIAFLERSISERKNYHLLQISNISDWMSLAQLEHLLFLCFVSLRPQGKLIARRFNGDYHLEGLMKEAGFLTATTTDSAELYSEVVIGTKPIARSRL